MIFHKIALNLQRHVLPLIQQWGKELELDFKNKQIKVSSIRTDSDDKYIHSPAKYSYEISIVCLEKNHIYYNSDHLQMSVYLSQDNATSKPSINAFVNMWVLNERGEDFYSHRISELFPYEQEPIVDKTVLKKLKDSLPDLYQSLRRALESKGKE